MSDVLDACGEAVNELDYPPKQANAANLLRFGWCLGWVQGLFERIGEVQVQARFEEMNAKKESKLTPPAQVADKGYLSICLPPGTPESGSDSRDRQGLAGNAEAASGAEKWPGEGGFAESLSLSRSHCRFGRREALGCETVTRVHP